MFIPTVHLTVNASGAAEAARRGDVVVIVDLVDMSTTLEAALDAGALAVYGAAPDDAAPPVDVNPEAIGYAAGRLALKNNTGVVLVAEPRVGADSHRKARSTKVMAGLSMLGVPVRGILPNIGAETTQLLDLNGQVVIAVTATGGVAYDAAFNAGSPAVLTGTVARTRQKKGLRPALAAAARAKERSSALQAGITVVAASANSQEDVLAAEYIWRLIMEQLLSTAPADVK